MVAPTLEGRHKTDTAGQAGHSNPHEHSPSLYEDGPLSARDSELKCYRCNVWKTHSAAVRIESVEAGAKLKQS